MSIEEITKTFNLRLQNVSREELNIYMGLMQYWINLHKTEATENAQAVEEYKKFFFSTAKRKGIRIPEEIKNMDALEHLALSKTKGILGLIEEYRAAIKQYYMENGLSLNSIRGSIHETLLRSNPMVNQFEAEKGSWVFASSRPDNKNTYRMRGSNQGMITLDDNCGEYLIIGDSFDIQNGRLKLKKPSYSYTLKCDKFMPVVRINNTREDANDFRFVFMDEWTSDEDIPKEDITSVTEISDVTDILENIQIFSTTDMDEVSQISHARWDTERKREIIKAGVNSGCVTYWNGALNINARDEYRRHKEDRTPESVENTITEPEN